MRKALLAVAALVVASAAPLQGQVAWDGPLLVGPETPAGWGVYLVDPASDAGIGFLTTWRGGGGGLGTGSASPRTGQMSCQFSEESISRGGWSTPTMTSPSN